jgi:hypothetical protein
MLAIDDRTRIASSRRQAEAREWCAACLLVSRREIRVSLAGFHTGRDRAARQEPLVRVRASLNQISDAAARANAGAWLGPGTHPGGLGVLNARDTPCPQPAACPNPRRTAGAARSHRLRSVWSATRRPGAAGRYGAAQGCTRAVSACSTRATCPALSRQRALLCAAAQGKLHLTACDRYGARRVSRAAQGGTGLWYRPIACGGGPPPRARTSCTGCACAWSCGATHGTVARACWG